MLHQLDRLLDGLLDDTDISGLTQRSIDQLRDLRDRLHTLEHGLSYGRRMAQGRLDIVMCEIDRRTGGDAPSELLSRLPDVLSLHTRSADLPRPFRDEELPAFAGAIIDDLDLVLTPAEMASLSGVDEERLAEIQGGLLSVERMLSSKRHEVHRLIDEVQEQIVARYRSGAASVDDLLR